MSRTRTTDAQIARLRSKAHALEVRVADLEETLELRRRTFNRLANNYDTLAGLYAQALKRIEELTGESPVTDLALSADSARQIDAIGLGGP